MNDDNDATHNNLIHNHATHNARDAQMAALLASAAVIAGFVLYWALQIQAVRESLAMAYG